MLLRQGTKGWFGSASRLGYKPSGIPLKAVRLRGSRNAFALQAQMKCNHWQELSSELWAGIFSLLQPDNLPLHLVTSDEAWLCQLPAVCIAFKAVFRTHPQLYCILWPRQLSIASSSQLTALTIWCQQHSQHVKTMVCMHGGFVAETALTSLQSEHVALTRLMLSQLPWRAMPLLANFTRLVECTLVQPSRSPTGDLSLRPLQGLSQLLTLTLEQGYFRDLDAAKQLTSLHMKDACVTCEHDCPSVHTLLKLEMYDTCLFELEHRGISACSILQDLTVNDSGEYGTVEDSFSFCVSPPRIPAGLSAMTALTRLQFAHSNRRQAHSVWRLDWLTVLTKLQSITAAICHFEVVLPSSIRTLTSFTALDFCCDKISVHVDWTALKLLKQRCLSGSSVLCHSECPLNGLLQLDNLEKVTISFVQGRTTETRKELGQFVSKIKHTRPDIKLCV